MRTAWNKTLKNEHCAETEHLNMSTALELSAKKTSITYNLHA